MQSKRSVATILALSLLTSSGFYATQDLQRSTGFVLDAGEHDLADIIDRVANYLGHNILTDPMAIAAMPGGATVVIQKRLEVDALGCQDLLSELLYTKGFALVPLDTTLELYEVIHMQGPKRVEIMASAIHKSPDEILRRPNLKIVVVTALPLQHLSVQVATNSLRPFFAVTGQPGVPLTIGNAGNNSAILLQGFAHQVGSAIRLLREVDVSASEPSPALEERLRALEMRVENLEKKVGN